MQATQLSNLDYALNYAGDFGWSVFPCHSIGASGSCTCGFADCKSPGKHPRTPHGSKDATTSLDQIEAWWQQWPDANIAVATGSTSGIAVVDVDAAKGGQSNELLIGDLDATVFSTVKVKTGGGLHFYYTLPSGLSIANSASHLGKFIDVRGEGGYVIAPPSVHVSGRRYEFLNRHADLLEFPQAWIARLNSPVSPNSNGNGHHHVPGIVVPPPSSGLIVPDQIDQGKRNVELTKLAGTLRRHGLSESAVYSALAIENQRICKPPLDDKEIHAIARSVGRYKPADVLNQVDDSDDAGAPDYENTLKPYLYSEFIDAEFEEKEILGFHIGKRDIAIIQAATNAGKTTLLRNIGLCMAAGRPFMPFYEGGRPIRLAYFDFENDAQDVQRDLRQMDDIFTPKEMAEIKKNLVVIPKGLMDGELFQFNTHEKWANSLIQDNKIEFIVVDNVSAAYDLNDENSNAEVTKKVIKPLLKMAYKGDCAFLFAHHYGKAKTELDHAGVHAGRGASALQALSRTVINMFGDVSKGEPVTVECAKRKTDGGQNYREVFRLEDDRWFHHTTIAPPPKKKPAYQALRSFFEGIVYPSSVSTGEVITRFEDEYTVDVIKKALNELYKDGFVQRPSHGQYCGKQSPDVPDAESDDGAKVRNFYEKDDD